MSETFVVLIVTLECEAEIIAIQLIAIYISPTHIPLIIMLLFPLSYFPADIPLIVFNRPSKTTQVRILNFDLINLRIFLVGSCHSAVLPLHDVLLVSVLKCPCICIDLIIFSSFCPKLDQQLSNVQLMSAVRVPISRIH